MKRRIISILAVCCMMVAMMPAAFAVGSDDLQTRINNATAGETITLTGNETISSTLVINKEITLDGNGNTLTMTGGTYAINVQTDAAVTVEDIQIDAEAAGGRGIYISATQPHFTLLNSTLNVNNRGIGFSDNGTVAGATVTVDNSTIQNSQKPENKTYENWSHQGDSRGIGFWNNKGITVDIKNNSAILGFGYPLNMVGDENGGRDMMNSTINITNSDIWGWCALNIWTIDATYNITNSHLKGYVETDNPWNSFATIVLNEDIYEGILDLENPDEKANVFNISGGSVYSTCISNDADVFHCLFRLDEEFMSEFNFSAYGGFLPVDLYCSQPYSAFVLTYDEMTMDDFTTWANEKLDCGPGAVTYYWGAIAPGVNAPAPSAALMQISTTDVGNVAFAAHEGGQCQ